jgi:hypothetical protein
MTLNGDDYDDLRQVSSAALYLFFERKGKSAWCVLVLLCRMLGDLLKIGSAGFPASLVA